MKFGWTLTSIWNDMSNLSTLQLGEKIVVFTTLGCPFCNQLKIYFKSKNICFSEVQISNYPVGFLAVDKIVSCGGPKFLPAVFSNSLYIGVCSFIVWFFFSKWHISFLKLFTINLQGLQWNISKRTCYINAPEWFP